MAPDSRPDARPDACPDSAGSERRLEDSAWQGGIHRHARVAGGQRALTALGHYGTPADVGAAVAFHASPAARQITGTTLNVDGGTNA